MAIKTNNFDVLLHFTFQILCFIIFSMIVTIFLLLFLFNFLDAYALQRFHNKCFVIYMFERLCGAIQRMFEFRNRIKIHVNQQNFAMSIEIFHIRWWPMLWWHCCCNFAVAGSMSIQLIQKAYFVCDSFIFFFFIFGRTSSPCHWSAQCSDTLWKESRSHHGKWHVYKWSYVYRYCNMSLWHSGRFC